MYQSVKTKRTLFTEEKVANIRKNIEKFDWAKEKAAKILEKADWYLAFGTDRIAFDIANATLNESCSVNGIHGCPNCGKEMLRHSERGWIIDVEKHPWKVKCPSCGNLYPSNDFEAFYRSGQDEHGAFSYDRADRSLLVNTLYPDEAPDYAVDDGSGWMKDPSDPKNGRYCFIPFYVFLGMWHNEHPDQPQMNYVMGAMDVLSQAYLITGDRKYGEPAVVLLHKIAEIYQTMDTGRSPWKDGYAHSDFGSGKGRFTGCIWDTGLVKSLVERYDMLFPCIDDDLAAYFRENPVRYFGEAPSCGADIIATIETKLLLQLYPDARAAILHCNPGPPHAMLVTTAIALQRDDLFDEYAKYVVVGGKDVPRHWVCLEDLIARRVSRDGFAGEVAPGYNAMWSGGFMETALLLKGSKYDLFQNVKFLKMGEMARAYVTCDDTTLLIGDYARCGRVHELGYIRQNTQVQYFLMTRDPRDAALLVRIAGDGPICTDWTLDCEAVEREIRGAAATLGAFRSESRCYPAFGLAAVESHPDGKEPESHSMWFGQTAGHGHRDSMNLTLHGFGIDLMPNFGYPDHATNNFNRLRWTSNMISHNTAMIPQTVPFTEEDIKTKDIAACSNLNEQWYSYGKLRHFHAGEKVSLIDAEMPDLYFGEPFRRTVVSVDLDGRSRYLVDLFDVGGEGGQRMSWHAMSVDSAVTGLTLVPQDGGTYAGTDVPYEDETYSAHYCNGFNYLKDVKRAANPDAGFTVDWKCFDNWHVWEKERDVHVKIHTLSAVEEAALCMGQPPKNWPGNPKELEFLILKNGAGMAHFVNVVEPYEDASFIETCGYSADGDTVTVTVTHKSGRVDTVTVTRVGTGCRLTVESTIGYTMSYGDTVLTGEVVDFTRAYTFENYVTVRLSGDVTADALVGKFVDIETDVNPNGFYEIKSAESLGGGVWKLGTGDCTLVENFVDCMAKEKGYLYFVKEGAKVRITM